jgi:hypothetical protein
MSAEIAFEETVRRIVEVAPGLHHAGTFSARALDAIVRHAQRRRIRHSVETGAGASTLLLSHLSAQHTVFAVDMGGSITNVKGSPLLRPSAVAFVEGPTQQTLPRYEFPAKLDLALIDGPHGYPFADLEYYYIYPHLDTGALLIIDDIQIPSVHNLFAFLKSDAMFRLDEVVKTTAFFTRTDAPTFDPLGDGWPEQKYNTTPLARYAWRQRILGLWPQWARTGMERLRQRMTPKAGSAGVKIVVPSAGESVGAAGKASGTAVLPAGSSLWVLVHRKGLDGWWLQGGGAVEVNDGRWEVMVAYGESRDTGYDFEIAALIVGPATHELWTGCVERVPRTGPLQPVRIPAVAYVHGEAYRTVKKHRHF